MHAVPRRGRGDQPGHRLVHGLRAAGLRRGDAFAVVLPNGVEFFTAYLAAAQAGFYLVPVNHHLVGPEIAWTVADSGAEVLIAHERFGAAARAAADEAGLPAERRYAAGTADGFRPYAELLDGQPETPPDGRALGWAMNYTSGTTGRPRGIRRPLPGKPPEETHLGGFLGIFGIRPFDDNVHLVCSPLCHTAVLQFSGASLHIGHRLVLMDRWTLQEGGPHTGRRTGRRDTGPLRHPAGRIQTPQERRLHRHHATPPQRQALQEAAARTVLGGPRTRGLRRGAAAGAPEAAAPFRCRLP